MTYPIADTSLRAMGALSLKAPTCPHNYFPKSLSEGRRVDRYRSGFNIDFLSLSTPANGATDPEDRN